MLFVSFSLHFKWKTFFGQQSKNHNRWL